LSVERIIEDKSMVSYFRCIAKNTYWKIDLSVEVGADACTQVLAKGKSTAVPHPLMRG
jgi:hypothetical protein